MPRPRVRTSRRRLVLVSTGIILFILITSLRGVAGFYTDFLWFDEVGFTSVWRGVLGAKVLLAAVFTAAFLVVMWTSLTIADRVAPRFRPVGPEDELVQRYREAVGPHAGAVRAGVSAVFALIFGLGVSAQWNSWLLFRNHVAFGVNDRQFDKDIGFYVFRLPFLSFLVDWVLVALIIVTFVTLVAHYLNGGIRLAQTAAERVTPAVKAHVSVLLGVIALTKAAGYYLQRFELSVSSRGPVDGPTYTDVRAQLPAIRLLIFISIIAALLFLANIFIKGWLLPGIAVGLWLLLSVLVGGIIPASVQRFTVSPAENRKERPYIARNIAATRQAYAIDAVEEKSFSYSENLTSADLTANAETIRNVRLWDPRFVQRTYQKLQEIRSYYSFDDVDVDRYVVDGQLTQTIMSARELNPSEVPSQWVNQRLGFTHGFGALLSPANAVTGDGKPTFLIKDIPPQGSPEIKEPRIYYGENNNSYAIVRSKHAEVDFQSAAGRTETHTYGGKGGVEMSSLPRRLAFALRFGDANPLISNLVTPTSRAMYVRHIGERVRKAAPFLQYDHDPYPIILNGRIVWVQDAYTVTSRYPYSQRAVGTGQLHDGSDLRGMAFNYIRNSVKVTTDAYDGTMKFYVTDPKDPIIRAYQRAFPALFTSASVMPSELRDHLRYPEDLFSVQTNMYGRYHISDPDDFYNASDAWDVSQDPGSGRIQGAATAAAQPATPAPTAATAVPVSQTTRMDAAYMLLRLPGEESTSFLILRPFVPTSRGGEKQQNLTAFMTAKSDPNSYGRLQAFVMPRGVQIDGPALINSRALADAEIAQELSLLDQRGSRVLQGNVLVIPIKDSLLYIRPIYVEAEANAIPEMRKVIVVYGPRAVMADTLQDALRQLFGDAPPTLEERPGTPAAPTTPPEGGGGAPAGPNVQDLLARASVAFTEANDALKAGDLARYQQKIREAEDLVRQAGAASAPPPTTTTTTPTA